MKATIAIVTLVGIMSAVIGTSYAGNASRVQPRMAQSSDYSTAKPTVLVYGADDLGDQQDIGVVAGALLIVGFAVVFAVVGAAAYEVYHHHYQGAIEEAPLVERVVLSDVVFDLAVAR